MSEASVRMPQPVNICRGHQVLRHGLRLVPVDDAGAEAVADVGGQGVHRALVLVQRDGEIAFVRQPELFVELLLEGRCPFEPSGVPVPGPRPSAPAGSGPDTPSRRRPALRRARWAVRRCVPSAKLMPSQESFQPWLTSPWSLGAQVLHEPVTVAVAVLLDPFQGPVRVAEQRARSRPWTVPSGSVLRARPRTAGWRRRCRSRPCRRGTIRR